MYFANSKRLNNASGATITDLALTSGAVVYSETVNIQKNVGFLCLQVVEDKAGGSGDVDIYAEYSDDGTTWQRAYVSDLAGSITLDGNIVTALQNVTRRIIHTARLAKFLRYAFDPDADSQITADVTFQEES